MKLLWKNPVRIAATLACAATLTAADVSVPKNLIGDWAIDQPNNEPGWLSVKLTDGKPDIRIMWAIGGTRPITEFQVDGRELTFDLRKQRAKKNGTVAPTQSVSVRILDGALYGVHRKVEKGQRSEASFTGKRLPAMPPKPDLSRVKFGKPIQLFNGRDLTGWKKRRAHKLMGWSVKDGLLVNDTPKIDFSNKGAYANLMTEREFYDFKLHIEFNIGAQRNSGVYLRGMYEAQVVDRDSRMQGLQGVGAIFSRIAPSKNVGKPGGEWNTYDLTLVDRHVTVILNGEKVIDNQPVEGPTGGAHQTDVSSPGPIYLQGDHTSVKYRNIVLTPVIKP
ncbi:MAG: 3-keto-disaccharide hydrolase [Verrucomicrobiia bacterium]|jgi:hypothetical protein